MRRRAVLVVAAVVVLLAGGLALLYGEGGSAPGGSSENGAVESDPRDEVRSALRNPNHPDFPEPLIEPDEIVTLLPPDRIPAIDDPQFQPADEVDWLEDDEAVLSLTVGEETRAYPLQVMTWHEIVNDTVDGTPVAVTYCPLCNSGVAFEREVDGRRLSFGTSGKLYLDNLVMYDRQTQSLWPQLTGEASVGTMTGTTLTPIPIGVVGWQQFREAHPDSLVLTRDTGHDRPYGDNPYGGYDTEDGSTLTGTTPDDDRLPTMARVVGVAADGEAVAIPRERLAEEDVMTLEVGDRTLVAWHRDGQSSALDDSSVAGGKEIGTVGVFDPTVGGEPASFTATEDGFEDDVTGSTWNVLGEAVGGPAEDQRLKPVRHDDTFWFAWVGFHPGTELLAAG